jgi:hypothetical protein
MVQPPLPVTLSVLREEQVRVLLWVRQFSDPSPVLYVSEQRHWREFFDHLREGAWAGELAVVYPENLSGPHLRLLGDKVTRVIVPVRAESIFSPTYGDILHGREFFGPTILVATAATLDIRKRYSRSVPAEAAGETTPPDSPGLLPRR